eukprot:424515_1
MQSRTQINIQKGMLIVPCINVNKKCMGPKALIDAGKQILNLVPLLCDIFNGSSLLDYVDYQPTSNLASLAKSMAIVNKRIAKGSFGSILFLVYSHMQTLKANKLDAETKDARIFQLDDGTLVSGPSVRTYFSFEVINKLHVVRMYLWLGCSGIDSIRIMNNNIRANPQNKETSIDDSWKKTVTKTYISQVNATIHSLISKDNTISDSAFNRSSNGTPQLEYFESTNNFCAQPVTIKGKSHIPGIIAFLFVLVERIDMAVANNNNNNHNSNTSINNETPIYINILSFFADIKEVAYQIGFYYGKPKYQGVQFEGTCHSINIPVYAHESLALIRDQYKNEFKMVKNALKNQRNLAQIHYNVEQMKNVLGNEAHEILFTKYSISDTMPLAIMLEIINNQLEFRYNIFDIFLNKANLMDGEADLLFVSLIDKIKQDNPFPEHEYPKVTFRTGEDEFLNYWDFDRVYTFFMNNKSNFKTLKYYQNELLISFIAPDEKFISNQQFMETIDRMKTICNDNNIVVEDNDILVAMIVKIHSPDKLSFLFNQQINGKYIFTIQTSSSSEKWNLNNFTLQQLLQDLLKQEIQIKYVVNIKERIVVCIDENGKVIDSDDDDDDDDDTDQKQNSNIGLIDIPNSPVLSAMDVENNNGNMNDENTLCVDVNDDQSDELKDNINLNGLHLDTSLDNNDKKKNNEFGLRKRGRKKPTPANEKYFEIVDQNIRHEWQKFQEQFKIKRGTHTKTQLHSVKKNKPGMGPLFADLIWGKHVYGTRRELKYKGGTKFDDTHLQNGIFPSASDFIVTAPSRHCFADPYDKSKTANGLKALIEGKRLQEKYPILVCRNFDCCMVFNSPLLRNCHETKCGDIKFYTDYDL